MPYTFSSASWWRSTRCAHCKCLLNVKHCYLAMSSQGGVSNWPCAWLCFGLVARGCPVDVVDGLCLDVKSWAYLSCYCGERNQVMRKFCAEEFRLPMKCRHHQRGFLQPRWYSYQLGNVKSWHFLVVFTVSTEPGGATQKDSSPV